MLLISISREGSKQLIHLQITLLGSFIDNLVCFLPSFIDLISIIFLVESLWLSTHSVSFYDFCLQKDYQLIPEI